MARAPKKRTGKTADSIFRQTTPPLVGDHPELHWGGYLSLDESTRELVEGATRDIQRRLKRTVQDIYHVGKRLVQIKEALPYGYFDAWVQEEFETPFGLTKRMAEHWMNVARRFSEDQVEKLVDLKFPLSALYQVAAPSTPEGAAEQIIEKVESEIQRQPRRKIPRSIILQMIQDHKEEAEHALKNIKLKEAGVVPEVQGMLLATPTIEDAREFRTLGRFEPAIQSKIAEKLFTGEAKNVRQANRQLEAEGISAKTVSGSTHSQGISVEFNNRVVYYPGSWQHALQSHVAEASIDFCFVETPLENDFLPVYRDLASALFRVLKPGGKALLTAGHRNIQFVGPCLEPPLRVNWTHVVRRTPARPPRVVGPNIEAGSILMSLAYREPWRMPRGMVQDTRYEDSTASRIFVSSSRAKAPSGIMPNIPLMGLEVALRYYLEHYTEQTDTILHLTVDPSLCFNLSSTMIEAAEALNHAKLIGIGSTGQ